MRSAAATRKPKVLGGPAQQHLDALNEVFGPEYFQDGRLVITVARDVQGVMKVAHKLQSKVNSNFGAMVEVIMEHVKHEWWCRLHESTANVGLYKGQEVPDVQVTHIPEGIRVHPYKRDHLPTLEVLLLWEDVSGRTQGHILYSMAHPEVPALEQVDEIFADIEPYFAKRWLTVELRLSAPVRGEFQEADPEAPSHDSCVGAGVVIDVLACHAFGFAGAEGVDAAHVTQCQPIVFKGISDNDGRARMCILPAAINKIHVAETDRFYGTEAVVPPIRSVVDGPTPVVVDLTPKAMAALTVHVFELPRKLPPAIETDGIIDWAAEERIGLPQAKVELEPWKDDLSAPVQLHHVGDGTFVIKDGTVPEGCVGLVASCGGFETEERPLMLLVGANEFYVPLRRADS
mmetsp:Transcript_59480/g.128652  ORF Transcript_59480/g.128652 Transcript_59480/m.128652 type:complete len:402 (-) Transcript_59480:123-1328(-)